MLHRLTKASFRAFPQPKTNPQKPFKTPSNMSQCRPNLGPQHCFSWKNRFHAKREANFYLRGKPKNHLLCDKSNLRLRKNKYLNKLTTKDKQKFENQETPLTGPSEHPNLLQAAHGSKNSYSRTSYETRRQFEFGQDNPL